MAAPDTIFKATYSSVPVYEMPCKGVAVMKRRADGWLNATQILKVAGFDKPQRTRVLEREVQKGTHEKVQGGYGKYQGTWIPPDLGLELAKQYGVDGVLMPIIEYVPPKGASPPPAPKHITAAPKGPRQKRTATPAGAGASTPRTNSMPPPPPHSAGGSSAHTNSVNTPPTTARATAAAGRASAAAAAKARNVEQQMQLQQQQAQALLQQQQQQQAQAQAQAQQQYLQQQQQQQQYYVDSQLSQGELFDESVGSPPLSAGSETSRTPSPLGSEPASEYGSQYAHMQSQPSSSSQHQQQPRRKRKHRESMLGADDQQQQQSQQSHHLQQQQVQQQQQQAASSGGPAAYARAILDYYISESASIPSFLISPPADFDPNVVIDDDGHTALHWACAMGRLRIVKLLLTAGADIFRANAIGQTALMRSVMFTNNYDLRKFPEMFELLHRSTINIDRTDRTVFHYAVDLALTKGKPHAAKYYLEVLLDRLKEYPREVADILNFQDEEGETALTLAARARFKSLVRILLNYGADPKLANRDGKSAEDYILEDERFRHQNDDSTIELASAPQLQSQQQQQMQLQQQLQYPHMQPQLVQQQQPFGQVLPQQQMDQPPQRMDSGRSVASLYPQQVIGTSQPQQMPNGFYSEGPQQQPQQLQQQAIIPGLASAGVQTIPLPLHYSETGQRVTNQLIPQVSHQFELLATAYDAELEDKERDISQAHSLLASIQAEAIEHAKIVNLLSKQAEQLEQVQKKEQDLRKELNDKMGKRFRLGWEKYVRDEEERQKAFVTITKNTSGASSAGSANKPIQQYTITLNESNTASTPKANGSNKKQPSSSSTPIPADIDYIFSSLPTSADALSAEVQTNVDKLATLKSQRKELFESLIKLQAEAGADSKIADYRKLIALGCGIEVDEVTPDFVKNVLENLDNGDELILAASAMQAGEGGDDENAIEEMETEA